MGEICFSSEEEMSRYIEQNSPPEPYYYEETETKTEITQGSYLAEKLFAEEIYNNHSTTLTDLERKRYKKQYPDLNDFITDSYYLLYLDKEGNKIDNLRQYNINYRNKYFDNWKLRYKTSVLRSSLQKSKIYTEYKKSIDNRRKAYNELEEINYKDKVEIVIEDNVLIKPKLTAFNFNDPLIELFIMLLHI